MEIGFTTTSEVRPERDRTFSVYLQLPGGQLSASGIKLHDWIEAIEGSIERVGAKRGFQES